MALDLSFKSEQDAALAVEWMKRFLEDEKSTIHKHEDPDSVSEELNEISGLIDELEFSLTNGIERISKEFLTELWAWLLALNDDTYKYQRNPEPISWGIWRVEDNQLFDFGYSKKSLYRVYVPSRSEHKIHEYKTMPPPIRWSLNPVVQKGLLFYTTTAKVEEIEQISSVPALPIEMSSEESGLRILDSNRGADEWQRRPMPRRIQSIAEFVGDVDNIVANAPILFIRDSNCARLENDILTIDFSKFLVPKKQYEKNNHSLDPDLFIDHEILYESDPINGKHVETYKDLRPIWLIDGQHRIRGMSRNPEGSSLEIPLIIFPSSFSLAKAAKIFAEINTLQEPLKPLHKLFMQHRFKIPSPIPKRNFEPWEADPANLRDSRANHLSYELIAKLASRRESPLFNKVRLFEQNDSKHHYVKADQWVNYSRAWFLGGPYGDLQIWDRSKEEVMYAEVRNYFQAFIGTVNHGAWDDNKDRWPDQWRYRSLLQNSTHFMVLIKLFPEVYSRVKYSAGDGITIEAFSKVLCPFKWVDWIDSDLKKRFGGGGEKGRTNLYVWMSDALKCKESHNRRAVMSENIKSVPGKGILAPPENPTIEVNGSWPSKSRVVRFYSKRPINARPKPSWEIMDQDGNSYNDLLKPINNEECILPYQPLLDNIDNFKITVKWSNSHSKDGTSSIRIHNT